MIAGIVMSIIIGLSSALNPMYIDEDFFASNLDAQAIMDENNFTTQEEIENYVIDYIETATATRDIDKGGNIIENSRQYLENNYSNFTWLKRGNRLTSDVTGAIPLNMKGPDFPASDFEAAVEASDIVSSYGGCGSIAMVGILDYFARFLNYSEIMADPYNSQDRIELATKVFVETPQVNLFNNTIVFPGDYKEACNKILSDFGLANVISCDYRGTLLKGGIKDTLLDIIVEKIDEGLPVTMYTGIMSGSGKFTKHYTNICGYEKWLGYDSNGNTMEKYFLEARLNFSDYQDTYICDDNILDSGMMGIIYYDINYNNFWQVNASDFAEEFVNSAGQGQYFFYNITQPVTMASGFSFNTNRLRCSYIENQYLVLSANRNNVVDAYLEIQWWCGVQRVSFTSALWSSMEAMGVNGKFSIQIYKNNQWQDYITYDLLTMSTSRDSPDSHVVLFPRGTTNFRFYAKHNYPSGDRNKGRIVLDNIDIRYH